MSVFENLPPTWIETTLGAISLDIRYGLTARAESDIEGALYLRISDINDYGEVVLSDPKFVPASNELDRYLLESGDVLIARSGSVGRSYVYTGSDKPWVFASYLIRFRLNQVIADPEYIAFYLRSPYFWRYVESMTRTVAQPNINSKELSRLPIPLPTLPEQRRIVEILRQANVLRRLRGRARGLTETFVNSLFDHLFYSHRTGWQSYKLRDVIAEIQTGKSISARAHAAREGYWGILKVSAVTYGEYRPEENKELPENIEPNINYEVKPGDLLVSRANTSELVGASAVVRVTPSNLLLPDKLWRLVLKPTLGDPIFLYGILNTRELRREISRRASGTSSSMKNISQDKFLDIEIELPSLEIQRRFSEIVTHFWDRIQEPQTKSKDLYDHTLQRILSDVFTGRLTVHWSERQNKEVHDAAIQRDILLGLRGEEPTHGDYRRGRVTQAEREEIEHQLLDTSRSMLAGLASFQSNAAISSLVGTIKTDWGTQFANIFGAAEQIKLPDFSFTVSDSLRNGVLGMDVSAIAALGSISGGVAGVLSGMVQSPMTSVLGEFTSLFEGWDFADHPRDHVLDELTREQFRIFLACPKAPSPELTELTQFNKTEGQTVQLDVKPPKAVTAQEVQETVGRSMDTVRRGLALLASLGLLATVSIPVESAEGPTFVTAYQSIGKSDDIRLSDLALLRKPGQI